MSEKISDTFNDKVRKYCEARQFRCGEAEAIRACIKEYPELYEAELKTRREEDAEEGREARHTRIQGAQK